jgi:hypothetical protein
VRFVITDRALYLPVERRARTVDAGAEAMPMESP